MHRAANIFFIAALLTATVLVGGVHTPVAAATFAFALMAFAFRTLELRERDEHAAFLSVPWIGLLLLAFAAALQIIPLPEFLQQVLSSRGLELVEGGLAAAGVGTDVGWRALSLEPSETADRVVRFAALAMVALVATNFRDRRAWTSTGRVIIGVALVVLAVGAVLDAIHLQKFPGGIYETAVGFRGPSTFVSLNHGAAFFGLGMIVAVSLAVYGERTGAAERAGYWVVALVFAGATVAHGSDGVPLALVVSAATGAFAAWWRAGRPTRLSRQTTVALAILATAALVVVVWLELWRTALEFFRRLLFEGEHGTRYELLLASTRMAEDFWVFGGGAGAVETIIPGYIDWTSAAVEASIPVVENDSLEILYGFGIVIGSIALACFASYIIFAARHVIDEERSRRFVIALASGVYLLLIAQLHFPLFALGVGVPAIVWLESLTAPRSARDVQTRIVDTGHVRVGLNRTWIAIAVLLVLVVGAVGARYGIYDPTMPDLQDEEEVADFIRQRPADHRVYVRLATERARQERASDALTLARWAAERNTSVRVRLFLARALANAGEVDEAKVVYRRLLGERGPDRSVIRAVLADFRDPAARAEVFGPHPDVWGEATKLSLRIEGAVPSAEIALALVSAHGDDPRAYRVATEAYLAMKQPMLARIWAELLLRQDLTREQGVVGTELLSRALMAAGEGDEAQALIDRAVRQNGGVPIPALHRIALRHIPKPSEADATVRERVELHYTRLCRSPIATEDVERCWTTEAWLAEQAGDIPAAERVLRRVHRKFGEPSPLGYFYLRNYNCHELEKLLGDVEESSPHRSTIDTLFARCENATRERSEP